MKGVLLRWGWRAVALLAVGGTLGLLGVSLGVVPVGASSGHWRITAAFLQFAKERSVATHSLGIELPPLDEPWLVMKGAGHYETGCKPCHGSPTFREPVIAGAMTPRPPYLGPRIGGWKPKQLFYIVKHGIKFTGMPAWPAQGRDDEVHAMVAFLLALPNLDSRSYERLVHGTLDESDALRAPLEDLHTPAPPAVATSCARCHGARGQGRGNAAFPKLAGQSREYLYNSMQAYAKARRHSGIMQPVSASLDETARRELAEYYASLPAPRLEATQLDSQAVERGSKIASSGLRAQGVPSCADCHGPSETPRNAAYPRLAGQYADYLVLQLELFKTQQRGGSPYAHIMVNVASRLRKEQMRDVALYYASLHPGASR